MTPPDSPSTIPAALELALDAHFGGYPAWCEQVVAMAQASDPAAAWLLLQFNPQEGRLIHHWAADPTTSADGHPPLLALNLPESAVAGLKARHLIRAEVARRCGGPGPFDERLHLQRILATGSGLQRAADMARSGIGRKSAARGGVPRHLGHQPIRPKPGSVMIRLLLKRVGVNRFNRPRVVICVPSAITAVGLFGPKSFITTSVGPRVSTMCVPPLVTVRNVGWSRIIGPERTVRCALPLTTAPWGLNTTTL